MKELKAYPPNFQKIVKRFPQARSPGVIFAYGDRIFNPSGVKLSRALIQHEELHCLRQMNQGVDAWWDAYIADKAFRFSEEVAAHVVEWQWHSQLYGHDEKYLRAICKRLAGPLYGSLADEATCRQLIENG